MPMTKEERTAYMREWRRNNPDKVKQQSRRYYQKHKDKMKATVKKWVAENKDHDKAYRKAWREKHKTRLKLKRLGIELPQNFHVPVYHFGA